MLTLLSFEVEFVDFNWTFFSTLSTSTFTSAVLLCFRHNFVSTFYQLCQPRHFKVQFSCVSVTTLFQLSTNFVNFNKKKLISGWARQHFNWTFTQLCELPDKKWTFKLSTALCYNFVNFDRSEYMYIEKCTAFYFYFCIKLSYKSHV